jgi:hypothetical protein
VLLLSVIVAVLTVPALLKAPPATRVELPLNVLLLTVNVAPPGPPAQKFLTPPPSALAELPLKVLLLIVTVAVPEAVKL